MSTIKRQDLEVLHLLNDVIKKTKHIDSGLRRTLSYVAAAFARGEGLIIEKDLRLYHNFGEQFDEIVQEELGYVATTVVNTELPEIDPDPFRQPPALLGNGSRRAQ